MNITLETVCRAIDAFYATGPELQEARQYLETFQKSEESWTICDHIIGQHTNSLACYFAAQTLRTKIRKEFKQLPPEAYAPLRQSLLQHLSKHGATAHDSQTEPTTTQLCLAIADLYIQVSSWNNWIIELLTQCQSLEGDRTVMTVTLLQVFAEEVEQISGIGENRRNAIRQELASCEAPMITFLTHAFNHYQNDANMLKKVLKTLESNLQNPSMKTDCLAESPLMVAIFHILASDSNVPSSLHEAATNTIVAALFRVEDVEKHAKLAQVLQNGIVQLAKAFKSAEEQEDLDRVQNLARIFVELAESFYLQIAQETNPNPEAIGSLVCLDLLLLMASYHDYTVIEMSFNVWFRLTEELFKYDDDTHIAKYKAYAEKFILALYEHCKLDPDDVNEIVDEKSEFGEFRLKAIEAIRDVVFLVSTDHCILMMFNKLEECARKPHPACEDSEAALFIMAAVVQNLLPEVDPRMKEILGSIIQLPVNSPAALISTSLALIGDCNDWFEHNSDVLKPVLSWIMCFSIDPRFSSQVADCLVKISARNSKDMVGHLPDLMTLISALEHSTGNGLKIELAINSVIRAAALIISRLPANEIKTGIEALCVPIWRNLHKSIEMANADGTVGPPSTSHAHNNNNNNNNNNNGGIPVAVVAPISHENKENDASFAAGGTGDNWASIAMKPIIWIDRVASVFKDASMTMPNCRPQCQVLVTVYEEFFKELIKATRKFESNSRLVEHSVRSIRLMFRSLGSHGLPYVEPIVQTMIDVYPRHPHSCFLYLSSVIVDEFGTFDEMRPGLLRMMETLSKITFEIFNQPQGCVNHPDTVDDLFRLAQRFTSRVTSAFFVHPISGMLFNCAIANLQLDHTEANRSVTKFIIEVLEQLLKAKRIQYSDPGVVAAEALVMKHGQELVMATVAAAVFFVTGSLARDMADILAVVGKLGKEKQKEWLIGAVRVLPNEPVKATGEQLKSFVENVARERDSYGIYKHMKELIRLFV